MEEVRRQTVKTEKFEMDCALFGSGSRYLVIIPGVSVKSVMLSAEAVAAAYARFAEKYTVCLFDRKRDIQSGYTVSDRADDTAAAMRALGIADADVFGASQGGMIAQLLAARYPKLVRRVALGSTILWQNAMSRATFDGWVALADAGEPRALNRDITKKVYSPAYIDRFKDAFAALEADATDAEMRRFSVLARACRTFDAHAEVEKIACPVLVLGTWDDAVLSGEGSVEIARRLRCPLVMYSGYGHAVCDEAPDFLEHLNRFFSE